MSNSVFIVVVVGIVLAMLVLMVRYARFIHKYPGQSEEDDAAKRTAGEKSPDSSKREE